MLDESPWRAEGTPRFLNDSIADDYDVIIVGAGITGLTAAYLLKRAGKRVAVFERDTIGSGETSNTTAHLTCVTDGRLSELAKEFGDESARLVWDAGASAIDLIESIVTELNISCGFQRVPGFLSTPFFSEDSGDGSSAIEHDAALAQRFGFPASFVAHGPIAGRSSMRIADQALFNPIEYVSGLALAVDGDGCVVRDQCEVGAVIDDPLAVIVDGNNFACKDLIIATHVPIVGKRNLLGATLFQTKLYPYSSYVLGARLPNGVIAPGLYWDTHDPYYYLRVHQAMDGLYAIFGGEDHKTGQETDTESCFARLTDALHRIVPQAQIERRWSGQVVETSDGLPFIGEVSPHQYVATGYAGNGMTLGSIAALVMSDAIAGVDNPWRTLFDPHRKASSLGSLATMVKENVDYPLYFIADRLKRDRAGVENVPRGGGRVLSLDGQRVAVHRRDDGSVVKVSAVCTHMGCLVRWNDAERTWDCPCHGSRFKPDGEVIGGPAESPLEKID